MSFSPHTRGCSVTVGKLRHQRGVFPAYAGMFLAFVPARAVALRFPRIRGDVPWV